MRRVRWRCQRQSSGSVANRARQVFTHPPRGAWRDIDQLEAATAFWVQRFDTARTHGSIGDLTHVELDRVGCQRKNAVRTCRGDSLPKADLLTTLQFCDDH